MISQSNSGGCAQTMVLPFFCSTQVKMEALDAHAGPCPIRRGGMAGPLHHGARLPSHSFPRYLCCAGQAAVDRAAIQPPGPTMPKSPARSPLSRETGQESAGGGHEGCALQCGLWPIIVIGPKPRSRDGDHFASGEHYLSILGSHGCAAIHLHIGNRDPIPQWPSGGGGSR